MFIPMGDKLNGYGLTPISKLIDGMKHERQLLMSELRGRPVPMGFAALFVPGTTYSPILKDGGTEVAIDEIPVTFQGLKDWITKKRDLAFAAASVMLQLSQMNWQRFQIAAEYIDAYTVKLNLGVSGDEIANALLVAVVPPSRWYLKEDEHTMLVVDRIRQIYDELFDQARKLDGHFARITSNVKQKKDPLDGVSLSEIEVCYQALFNIRSVDMFLTYLYDVALMEDFLDYEMSGNIPASNQKRIRALYSLSTFFTLWKLIPEYVKIGFLESGQDTISEILGFLPETHIKFQEVRDKMMSFDVLGVAESVKGLKTALRDSYEGNEIQGIIEPLFSPYFYAEITKGVHTLVHDAIGDYFTGIEATHDVTFDNLDSPIQVTDNSMKRNLVLFGQPAINKLREIDVNILIKEREAFANHIVRLGASATSSAKQFISDESLSDVKAVKIRLAIDFFPRIPLIMRPNASANSAVAGKKTYTGSMSVRSFYAPKIKEEASSRWVGYDKFKTALSHSFGINEDKQSIISNWLELDMRTLIPTNIRGGFEEYSAESVTNSGSFLNILGRLSNSNLGALVQVITDSRINRNIASALSSFCIISYGKETSNLTQLQGFGNPYGLTYSELFSILKYQKTNKDAFQLFFNDPVEIVDGDMKIYFHILKRLPLPSESYCLHDMQFHRNLIGFASIISEKIHSLPQDASLLEGGLGDIAIAKKFLMSATENIRGYSIGDSGFQFCMIPEKLTPFIPQEVFTKTHTWYGKKGLSFLGTALKAETFQTAQLPIEFVNWLGHKSYPESTYIRISGIDRAVDFAEEAETASVMKSMLDTTKIKREIPNVDDSINKITSGVVAAAQEAKDLSTNKIGGSEEHKASSKEEDKPKHKKEEKGSVSEFLDIKSSEPPEDLTAGKTDEESDESKAKDKKKKKDEDDK